MDLKLDGKLALVTGSTAGIGYAIAARLLGEGARVIVNGRRQVAVDEAIAKLKQETGKAALGFAGDMADSGQAKALAKAHPDIDILVNNLGIFEPKEFLDIPDEDWRRFFDVNVLSGVRLARLVLPSMKARNWGRIIFISSESGIQIPVEMIHYGMTKAAQIAIARGLAESVAGTNITVNSILPGPTQSRGVGDFVQQLADSAGMSFEEYQDEFFRSARPTSLIKRFEAPDEIATMVAYIASPLASGTTGAALRVEGGLLKGAF